MTTANTQPITTDNIDASIAELEAAAHELAQIPFHLQSPRQVSEIFVKLGLPALKNGDDGLPGLSDDILRQLAEIHPLPKLLLDHRELLARKAAGISG